jgi:ribosomal protein S6--L-glutamate ligase
VIKPNNGSSLKDVYRVDTSEELARLAIDDSTRMLAQPYLANPGYDPSSTTAATRCSPP